MTARLKIASVFKKPYLTNINQYIMKRLTFTLIFLCVLSGISIHAQVQEYYQLKTYTFDTEAQEKITDDYLENAFLPALKEYDIMNVGVFKPHDIDSVAPKRTYVLIPFSSLTKFQLLDEALAENETHNANGKPYLEAAHDNPPYERISSVLMKAFVAMPNMKASPLEGPREERIYELRSYEASTEDLYKRKVDMFNAGGEVALFDRLAFNAVFYAEVLSGPTMPNLMYMTTHENMDARTANWEAFVESPEWTELKVMPKYQNTVSKNVTILLYPTAYSDY